MFLVCFKVLQNLEFLNEKLTLELVLKSFSGKNNPVEAPGFRFCNTVPYDLEELREFRALISWVLA